MVDSNYISIFRAFYKFHSLNLVSRKNIFHQYSLNNKNDRAKPSRKRSNTNIFLYILKFPKKQKPCEHTLNLFCSFCVVSCFVRVYFQFHFNTDAYIDRILLSYNILYQIEIVFMYNTIIYNTYHCVSKCH